MVSHAVKALKAIKITSALNFRFRLSYACARLIFVPFIGLRLAVWTNPLAFTNPYYQTQKPKMQQQKLPDGKTNFSSVMGTLENTADVDGKTENVLPLTSRSKFELYWALACLHSLRF